MNKRGYRRKMLNLKVKRCLQIWLMIRIGGIIGLTSLISVLILYGYAHHEMVNSFYDAHIKIRRVSQLLIPVVLAGGTISIIGGALLAILLPQKLAGPLYRIEQDMEQIKQGNLSRRTQLRKGDTLIDFARQVNETVDSVDTRLAQAQALCTQLKSQQQGLTNEQQQLFDQLQRTLHQFTTTNSPPS